MLKRAAFLFLASAASLAAALPADAARRVDYADSRHGFSLLGVPDTGGSPLLTDTALTGRVTPAVSGDVAFTLRLRSAGPRRDAGYTLFMATASDTLRVYVTPGADDDPVRGADGTDFRAGCGSLDTRMRAALGRKRFDRDGGFNMVRMERTDGAVSIAAGRDALSPVEWKDRGELRLSGEITAVGIEPGRGNRVEVERAQMVTYPTPFEMLATGLSADETALACRPAPGSLCGQWVLLDYDVDDRNLRCGGDYRLAVVPWNTLPPGIEFSGIEESLFPEYAIIYMEGARVDGDRWRPGMLKGALLPTALQNTWRLVWYDSMGEPLSESSAPGMSTASRDEHGAILTLSFPERYSSIRLVRSGVGMKPVEKVVDAEIGE